MDKFVKKLISINRPEMINGILKHHRAFFYYPDPDLCTLLLDYYIKNNEYDFFLEFYDNIKDKYYVNKSPSFYNKAITFAIDNNHRSFLSDLFVDIIDYSKVDLIYLNKIIYYNKHLLDDKVFFKCLDTYISLKESNIINDKSIIPYYFYKLCYVIKNDGSNVSNINTIIENLNRCLGDNSDNYYNEEHKIIFNNQLLYFMKDNAGCKYFKSINLNKLANYFESPMNINIHDENTKNIDLDVKEESIYPKEYVRSSQKPERQKTIKSKDIIEEVLYKDNSIEVKKRFSFKPDLLPGDLEMINKKKNEGNANNDKNKGKKK